MDKPVSQKNFLELVYHAHVPWSGDLPWRLGWRKPCKCHHHCLLRQLWLVNRLDSEVWLTPSPLLQRVKKQAVGSLARSRLNHEGGRREVYEPVFNWPLSRQKRNLNFDLSQWIFEVVTDWPQRSPFLLHCRQQREFLDVLIFMHLPLVHGSPFLSLVMTVKVDLCPTLARLNPGPSAHDSIGNTSLVVTWPSLAMALESCSSLEENSTIYRETVDF